MITKSKPQTVRSASKTLKWILSHEVAKRWAKKRHTIKQTPKGDEILTEKCQNDTFSARKVTSPHWEIQLSADPDLGGCLVTQKGGGRRFWRKWGYPLKNKSVSFFTLKKWKKSNSWNIRARNCNTKYGRKCRVQNAKIKFSEVSQVKNGPTFCERPP